MRRREFLSRLFLFSPPSNSLPSSLIRSVPLVRFLFLTFQSPLYASSLRDINEVLCIFDMSGGADCGGLIIDDDKNLTRKIFRGGKQRKHGGNVRHQQSGTLNSLELPIFPIFREL